MKNGFLKRGDIILAAALIFAAVLGAAAILFLSPAGKTVIIKQDNSVVYSGRLSVDKEIALEGNTAVIKSGTAFMADADCKNQICAHHKKISKSGESIICLPNRVIIEIK